MLMVNIFVHHFRETQLTNLSIQETEESVLESVSNYSNNDFHEMHKYILIFYVIILNIF